MAVQSGGYITLPTSGGTASQLNYYEEITGTATFGGVASTTAAYTLIRVGKMVTLHITTVTATATSSDIWFSLELVPSRMRPKYDTAIVVNTFWTG